MLISRPKLDSAKYDTELVRKALCVMERCTDLLMHGRPMALLPQTVTVSGLC